MTKYLLAAAAIASIAAPATARDGSPYVGIEGGILFPADTKVGVRADGEQLDDLFRIKHKRGFDVDVIAGYDFGLVRAEAELGWKRTKLDGVTFRGFDDDFDEDELEFENDRASVLSLMGNVLLDIGGDRSFGAYVGGGFGRARVKLFGEKDDAWAWQLIAGARTAVSPNIDIGLKYRYFNTARLEFADRNDPDFDLLATGRFRSHSLLASLIFNFGGQAPARVVPAAPPPPPPPPPPPATRTCPDGTVVLASEPCPFPPPPPPPPPPRPERG
jgi:OmpA-OmpF porin, OOP family